MKKLSFHKSNNITHRFSIKAFHHLKAQFNKLSKNDQITQVQFRSIMGLLGMETASFLSDRLFSIIDNKKLGVVYQLHRWTSLTTSMSWIYLSMALPTKKASSALRCWRIEIRTISASTNLRNLSSKYSKSGRQ